MQLQNRITAVFKPLRRCLFLDFFQGNHYTYVTAEKQGLTDRLCFLILSEKKDYENLTKD